MKKDRDKTNFPAMKVEKIFSDGTAKIRFGSEKAFRAPLSGTGIVKDKKTKKQINFDNTIRSGNDIIIVRKKQGAKDWFELSFIEPDEGDRVVLATFDTIFWNGLNKELRMNIIDKAIADYGGWY